MFSVEQLAKAQSSSTQNKRYRYPQAPIPAVSNPMAQSGMPAQYSGFSAQQQQQQQPMSSNVAYAANQAPNMSYPNQTQQPHQIPYSYGTHQQQANLYGNTYSNQPTYDQNQYATNYNYNVASQIPGQDTYPQSQSQPNQPYQSQPFYPQARY